MNMLAIPLVVVIAATVNLAVAAGDADGTPRNFKDRSTTTARNMASTRCRCASRCPSSHDSTRRGWHGSNGFRIRDFSSDLRKQARSTASKTWAGAIAHRPSSRELAPFEHNRNLVNPQITRVGIAIEDTYVTLFLPAVRCSPRTTHWQLSETAQEGSVDRTSAAGV
jgi:hypothetical protein